MASNINIPKARGLSLPLKICLGTFLFVVVLFLAAAIYMGQMPGVQAWQRCKDNMMEVSAAISRYEDVNGQPPATLEALKKDYLKDPSVLRCPSDKSPGDAPSYKYNPKATGTQVMLECDREKLPGERLKMQVLADGTFTMVPELDIAKPQRR